MVYNHEDPRNHGFWTSRRLAASGPERRILTLGGPIVGVWRLIVRHRTRLQPPKYQRHGTSHIMGGPILFFFWGGGYFGGPGGPEPPSMFGRLHPWKLPGHF